ncbi:MAG: hypothetical protein GTO02_12700, partial [Candidatus Dadabacteria bacterium]|nr:hypothetical protein [Candidatus Dadabacteria bacterium]
INIDIDSEGNASGVVEVNQTGVFSLGSRMVFQRMKAEFEEKLIENMFISQGLIGSGKIEKDDPSIVSSKYNFKIDFDVKNYIQ